MFVSLRLPRCTVDVRSKVDGLGHLRDVFIRQRSTQDLARRAQRLDGGTDPGHEGERRRKTTAARNPVVREK